MVLALRESFQFVLDELLPERGDAVNEQFGVQMVEFVLHDTSEIAVHPFVVELELFVSILYPDACMASHILMDSG